jgi:acetyltransferase-like isoleucine patch superfamily enzyme
LFQDVFIHKTAEVSEKAIIGKGTKIWNLTQVRENASIGENCILSKNVYVDFEVKIGNGVKLQNNVNVYHGVELEDDVFIGPSATFSNDMYPRAFISDFEVTKTSVKKGASIGANTTIVCGTVIGRYAMIGSGSVVTKDVKDYNLVVGNPGRVIGYVCKCGRRLDENLHCPVCSIKYRKNEDGSLSKI